LVIESGEPEMYSGMSFFFIPMEGIPVPFLSEEKKLNDSSITVKLQDVNNEAAARMLSGKDCFVEKSGAIETAEDVDWNSLIGYTVVDVSFGSLGMLENIQEFPQQLIGQCTVKGKEVLFPVTDELIQSIDHNKKVIELNLPEGLLNIYLE
jgi:16S rRNA processing protein RimM